MSLYLECAVHTDQVMMAFAVSPGKFTLRAGVDYWVNEDECTACGHVQAVEIVTVGLTEGGCLVVQVKINIVYISGCIVAIIGP